MCLRGAASPESGWIFYTFFKVHRHFCVFSCIPASVCQCHCPQLDVAGTVRMVDWYTLTRSSLSPFFRWHRDTKCEPGARQADYYNTAAAAAEPGERRSCTVERGRERRLVPTRRNTSGQQEESWEKESDKTLTPKIQSAPFDRGIRGIFMFMSVLLQCVVMGNVSHTVESMTDFTNQSLIWIQQNSEKYIQIWIVFAIISWMSFITWTTYYLRYLPLET